MKNYGYGIFTMIMVLFIAFAINSCKKDGGLPVTKGQLLGSTDSIKVNQLDSLILTGSKTDSVSWTVSPAGFDSIFMQNNKALVKFTKEGNYTVTAIDSGVTKIFSIKVSGFYNISPGPYSTLSMTTDQLVVAPFYFKSQTSDTTNVFLRASTTNHYVCSNDILLFFAANGYFDFEGLQTGTCIGGNPILSSGMAPFSKNPTIANGTYPLTINFNHVMYSGSMVVTTTDITFYWTYTSGVTISPMHIKR